MLMEFKRSDERNFPLKDLDREEIGTWVEARIFDFLDTYLQLETHPLYQKDNVVTDPVCGMRFPLLEAVARIERKDETIYFCSEPCKIAYLKKHKDVTTE
jgi:YHS domain-containing protein